MCQRPCVPLSLEPESDFACPAKIDFRRPRAFRQALVRTELAFPADRFSSSGFAAASTSHIGPDYSIRAQAVVMSLR